MLSFRSAIVLLIACLGAVPPAMASTLTTFPGFHLYDFNFSAFPIGVTSPFAETLGDFTILYSAPNDPFAFATVNSADIPASPGSFPLLLGGAGSSTLHLSLSHSAFGAFVEFVSLGPGPIQMDLLRGGLGGTVIESRNESGVIPPGLIYPEGFISLLPVCVCPNSFDAVTLSSDSNFAVRRISIAQNVPEPATLGLLSIGLLLAAPAFARMVSGPSMSTLRRVPQSPKLARPIGQGLPTSRAGNEIR